MSVLGFDWDYQINVCVNDINKPDKEPADEPDSRLSGIVVINNNDKC